MLIKQSVEFIRYDNKVSCDCSRRILVQRRTSVLSKKNLDNLIKSEFHLQFCYNCRDCITFKLVLYGCIYLSQSKVCDRLFSVSLMFSQKGSFLLDQRVGRQGGYNSFSFCNKLKVFVNVEGYDCIKTHISFAYDLHIA